MSKTGSHGKTEGNFIAKVAGKKYDLSMGSAINRACQAISNLLTLSPALKEQAPGAEAAAPLDGGASAPEAPAPDAGEEAFNDLPAPTAAPEETPPPAEA